MNDIQRYLSEVKDFRMEKKCLHKLSDILFIGLLTCLSNGEDYEDMALFAQSHESFLREYLELPNGIPSHDTFNRVFSVLEPNLLRQCLNEHRKGVLDLLSEKQICLDGKKLKGVSPTGRGNRGLYTVNARVAENRLCTGQKKVEDKSQEYYDDVACGFKACSSEDISEEWEYDHGRYKTRICVNAVA